MPSSRNKRRYRRNSRIRIDNNCQQEPHYTKSDYRFIGHNSSTRYYLKRLNQGKSGHNSFFFGHIVRVIGEIVIKPGARVDEKVICPELCQK